MEPNKEDRGSQDPPPTDLDPLQSKPLSRPPRKGARLRCSARQRCRAEGVRGRHSRRPKGFKLRPSEGKRIIGTATYQFLGEKKED